MSEKRKKPLPSCASCEIELINRRCIHENGKPSKGCPSVSWKKVLQKSEQSYDVPECLEFAKQASRQERDGYHNNQVDVEKRTFSMNPHKTRIVEICEFAKKMSYSRIGLAFCAGLISESAAVQNILQSHGFEVVSVICKAGAVPKERINIKKEEFIIPQIGELIPGASEIDRVS